MKAYILLAAMAFHSTLISQAVEPGKSQSLTSPDQVPQGLEKSDWQSIREAYQANQLRSAKKAGLATQKGYSNANIAGAGDGFGASVAISGDTVIVGAPKEDSNATGVNGDQMDNSAGDSGAAYVFVRSAGAWSQQAYLKASNTGAFDEFGFSVAISGDTVVVGAIGDSSNTPGGIFGNSSGAAYVFVRSEGAWSQQAYLKARNTGASDLFGTSVAISGDTVVVGASGEESYATGVNGNEADNGAYHSGAVYVFTRTDGFWSQQAYLKASNTGEYDEFGKSVAISGDTVVVGAVGEASNAAGVNGRQKNNSAIYSGAAYVFVRNAGVWSQQAYLKASNTGAFDFFGRSVAISGDTLVVGAMYEESSATGVNGNQADNSASSSGATYVFTRSGGAWSQQAYLKASNTGAFDQFGFSVAISGDTVVVGAAKDPSIEIGSTSGNGSGAAYVFERSAGAWSQQAYLKASNPGGSDQFKIRVKSKSKLGEVIGAGIVPITGNGIFTQGSTVTLKAKPKKAASFSAGLRIKNASARKRNSSSPT
ncbi:MAG: integrin [Akkermansiaceae bacterium]|nr:integrin [Akkermansiaceae bacterium]